MKKSENQIREEIINDRVGMFLTFFAMAAVLVFGLFAIYSTTIDEEVKPNMLNVHISKMDSIDLEMQMVKEQIELHKIYLEEMMYEDSVHKALLKK